MIIEAIDNRSLRRRVVSTAYTQLSYINIMCARACACACVWLLVRKCMCSVHVCVQMCSVMCSLGCVRGEVVCSYVSY